MHNKKLIILRLLFLHIAVFELLLYVQLDYFILCVEIDFKEYMLCLN